LVPQKKTSAHGCRPPASGGGGQLHSMAARVCYTRRNML
jgi:hypothetical protein